MENQSSKYEPLEFKFKPVEFQRLGYGACGHLSSSKIDTSADESIHSQERMPNNKASGYGD